MITRRKYLPSQYVVPQSDVSIMLWQIKCAAKCVEAGKKPFSHLYDVLAKYHEAIDMNTKPRVAAYKISECVQMLADALDKAAEEENKRAAEEALAERAKRQK